MSDIIWWRKVIQGKLLTTRRRWRPKDDKPHRCVDGSDFWKTCEKQQTTKNKMFLAKKRTPTGDGGGGGRRRTRSPIALLDNNHFITLPLCSFIIDVMNTAASTNVVLSKIFIVFVVLSFSFATVWQNVYGNNTFMQLNSTSSHICFLSTLIKKKSKFVPEWT